jgi:biotin transport system substrate-specific component
MPSQALIPYSLRKFPAVWSEALCFGAGLVLLISLAQVKIPLPFTPVPITGQTFGVALIALSWGRVRAPLIVLSYLLLGALGLPVFAGGLSGFTLGPTSGYLIGMVFASWLMGSLADRGWTQNFLKCWLAAILGGIITLTCGAVVLSLFVPAESVFAMGVFPFLIGDFIKNLAAAYLSWHAASLGNRKL